MAWSLNELAMRWVMQVGGPPSPRGASPWEVVPYEWRAARPAADVVTDLRAVVTPRLERTHKAVRSMLLVGLEDVNVTGQVGGADYALRAARGIRTPWRQRMEGRIRSTEDGSVLTARLRPTRLAAVYFSGVSGLAVVAANVLILGAIVGLPFASDVSVELAGGALATLVFGGFAFFIGRWSCRLGIKDAEHLLSLIDQTAGAVGLTPHDG